MRSICLICLLGLTSFFSQVYAQTFLSLAQAQNLEKLGFTDSAAQVYEALANQDPVLDPKEVLAGQIRTALALERPQTVLNLVNSHSDLLQGDEISFFEGLCALQQGDVEAAQGHLALVKPDRLDSLEQHWWTLAEGVLAYLDGRIDDANKYWSDLDDTDAGEFALVLRTAIAAGQTHLSDPQTIEKNFKKLRDWALVKLSALALAKAGQTDQALALLDKRSNPEKYLVMAYLMPVNTPQRRENLLKVLDSSDPHLVLAGLALGLDEPQISLIELQDLFVSHRVALDEGELLLAKAWWDKSDLVQSAAVWKKVEIKTLSDVWKSYYYWLGVKIAHAQTPPNYSESIELLKSWIALDPESSDLSSVWGVLADDNFKSHHYSTAGDIYAQHLDGVSSAERARRLSQAVLAYLRADRADRAKSVLLDNDWDGYAISLLEYVRVLAAKGTSVDSLMEPFASKKISVSQKWGFEYLKLQQMDPQKGLSALDEYLSSIPQKAPWRINFELKRYDWLLEVSPDQAYDYLDNLALSYPGNTDIIRRQLEAGFARHQAPADLLSKLESLKLPPADEARILLSAAQSDIKDDSVLAYAQKVITSLPAGSDRDGLVLWLLKIKVQKGMLDEALAGCDRLLETDISADLRNRSELLRASVLEAMGDGSAETAYLSLTQRDDESIRIRAQARLAVYYANRGEKDQAKDLLRGELLGYLTRGNLSTEVLRDLAYAYANLAGLLSQNEADLLQEWLKNYASGYQG